MKDIIKNITIGFIGITLIFTIAYFIGCFVRNYEIFGTMEILGNPDLIVLGFITIVMCVFIVSIVYLVGKILLLWIEFIKIKQ